MANADRVSGSLNNKMNKQDKMKGAAKGRLLLFSFCRHGKKAKFYIFEHMETIKRRFIDE